jgi:hypothetical protein
VSESLTEAELKEALAAYSADVSAYDTEIQNAWKQIVVYEDILSEKLAKVAEIRADLAARGINE